MNRLAVYTAITGKYDTLRQPERSREDADYICFSSDIPEKRVGVWQIRPIPLSGTDPVLASRFPKLNPHLALSGYDASLYVDANVLITEELDAAADRALASGTPCAMVPHPDRKSVYEEGLFLVRHSIGEPFKVYGQIRELAKRGFPDDTGLYVCSVIFRHHLEPRVVAFSEAWWRQFLAGAKRDQLSVMPALAEATLVPEVLVASDYVIRNTVPHAARTGHSVVWHGWHFAVRKTLEIRMRRMFAVSGIGVSFDRKEA